MNKRAAQKTLSSPLKLTVVLFNVTYKHASAFADWRDPEINWSIKKMSAGGEDGKPKNIQLRASSVILICGEACGYF